MNTIKLFFLLVFSFGLTNTVEEVPVISSVIQSIADIDQINTGKSAFFGNTESVDSNKKSTILSQKRIIRKMIRFRAAMQRRNPLSRLWKVGKVSMVVLGTVGTAYAIANDTAAFLGYPLTTSYVPAQASSWGEWLGSKLFIAISCVGVKLLYNTIDRSYGKKITLAWFVGSHSTFYETIRLMYAEIKDAALIDTTPDKDLLKKLYEKLIDQTEEICAYMLRSENMFEQERRLKVNAMRTAFVEKLEVLYADFAQAIEDNGADLIIKLDNITTTIEQTCVRFTAIEGSHWIDPQLIYDMMQRRFSAV